MNSWLHLVLAVAACFAGGVTTAAPGRLRPRPYLRAALDAEARRVAQQWQQQAPGSPYLIAGPGVTYQPLPGQTQVTQVIQDATGAVVLVVRGDLPPSRPRPPTSRGSASRPMRPPQNLPTGSWGRRPDPAKRRRA